MPFSKQNRTKNLSDHHIANELFALAWEQASLIIIVGSYGQPSYIVFPPPMGTGPDTIPGCDMSYIMKHDGNPSELNFNTGTQKLLDNGWEIIWETDADGNTKKYIPYNQKLNGKE